MTRVEGLVSNKNAIDDPNDRFWLKAAVAGSQSEGLLSDPSADIPARLQFGQHMTQSGRFESLFGTLGRRLVGMSW